MELRQNRVLLCQRRVLAWCAANPGLVPPTAGPSDTWTPVTRQVDALNKVVAVATTSAAEQTVKGAQVTLDVSGEGTLRTRLRGQLRAVTKVAHALRKTVPGISVLKMPSPKARAEVLVKAAEAFIAQATTYETVLVEHTLPPDFVARLQASAGALQSSVDGRGAARGAQVSATKQLTDSLSLGMKYVRILDSALTTVLESDPAKLAEWKNISRITIKGVSNTDVSTSPVFKAADAPLPVTEPGSIPEADAKAA